MTDRGNFCFANSWLQLLFSRCLFSCISSSFSFTTPVPAHYNNAEFISESCLCHYGKPKYVYWGNDGKYRNMGLLKVVEFLPLKIQPALAEMIKKCDVVADSIIK